VKYIKTFNESKEQSDGREAWWKKYAKYQLSAYPTNVPEKDVTVDLTGDIDTHPVLTWNSPTTGKKVYSYTKKRIDTQKAEKYARIEKLSQGQVDQMRTICHDVLTGDDSDEKKQSAAIVSIIAQTGLRPGSRKGFEETNNRGVSTLSASNIVITGSTVKLNFTGKSYHENNAELKDGAVANYLSNRVKGMKPDDFVFDVSRQQVDAFMKAAPKMSKFKVKDLRTHIANRIAKEFLEKDPLPPPPVPDNPAEIKKAVKTKLRKAFEAVSNKLNNSPAMARGSYVNPGLINEWLRKLGIGASAGVLAESEEVHDAKIVGNVPVYKLPEWWDSDDIELVKL
jgi:DNA topoisomerase IB